MSEMPPPRPEASAEPRPIPWEDPREPLIAGFFKTIGLFVTHPVEAYERAATGHDLIRPVLYMILIGWPLAAIAALIGAAFRGMMQPLMAEGPFAQFFTMEPWMTVVMVAVYPVLALVGLLIASAILHVMLLLVGGAGQGFAATVRAVCYATTAALARLVPICGDLLTPVWQIVLLILGLAAMHRISRGTAALAVLVPIALCCLCIGVVIAAAVFLGLGASGAFKG